MIVVVLIGGVMFCLALSLRAWLRFESARAILMQGMANYFLLSLILFKLLEAQ